MTGHNPEIQTILDSHIARISGVRGAVVVSDEGAHMYWSLVEKDTAERRAPLASALGSVAARYAIEEGTSGIRRVLLDLDDGGHLTLARVGRVAFLALSIAPQADLSVVGHEAALLTNRLAHVLDSELRVPGPTA